MERQVGADRHTEVVSLASELLRQGRRCALAGLRSAAEEILAQVWMMACDRDPDLANTAAWESAWLQMRAGDFEQAARWFERVVALPSSSDALWPQAQQALLQICRLQVAEPAPAAPPTLHLPPPACLPLLAVTNLGSFQVARDGRALPPCTTRKPLAVFRYLLTRHHCAAHKEELMELFWPDAAPRAAAHSLQMAISTLRGYLDPTGASYLCYEAGRYRITPGAQVEDDRGVFLRLCDAGDLAWAEGKPASAQSAYSAAIACYQGDYYLDDHDYVWAVAERERLRARYLAALDHLGRLFMDQEQLEPAISCYQRLLERDGYREDAHCQLMRCFWRLGRRADALEQYRHCATILASDLSLEPMEETRALHRAILGSDAAA